MSESYLIIYESMGDCPLAHVFEHESQSAAEIAAQASLTGHLVLATLHTNDAVGAIRRFTDLGLDPGTVTETLRGVLAQRLIRTVCTHCSVAVEDRLTPAEQSLADSFGVPPTVRAIGCDSCSGQGYLGRVPITELLD